MTETREVALELASFLDSSEATRTGLPRADLRAIAERFLDACYAGVGKKPRLLDAEDLAAILGELLPARMARKDRLAEVVPAVLAAYFDHLEATQVVTQSFELRAALERHLPAFVELVSAGRNAPAAPVHQAPFVHGAAKVGRNDPCSCGSGKKYKKCHGKGE
jgi:hypothetical protein